MSTPDRRAELMAEEGIEDVIILPFNREVAQMSAEAFVRSTVVESLDARAVLVGHNFRFGHKQSGGIDALIELGGRYGFRVEIAAEVKVEQWTVSSSAIRQAVKDGRMGKARRMLTRPFALDGSVVKGQGIGSKQTVPTLNLSPDTTLMPAVGVYVTRTLDLESERQWQSVTNVGYRPTFDGEGLTVETFLLSGFDGSTPVRIRVEFLWRLRDERRFDSSEALKAQILRDVERSRKFFTRLVKWDNGKRSLQ